MNIDFTLTINHYFPDGKSPASTLADLLSQMEKRIVSALTDAITAASASADAAISRIQAEQASLQAMVAALQAQIDAGGASPADIQALADLKAKLDQIDVPPTPNPPTP